MKRFAILVFLSLMLSINSNAQSVKFHGQLSVSGTQLSDSNGNSVVLRGMSFGWHNWWPRFYNAGSVKWLKDDWKCNVVRAAMGIEPSGGYLSDSAYAVDKIKAVVDAAIAEDIYVLIDWHSHNINLAEAKAFFTEIAKTYGEYPNVIYEIFNEPDDNQNWPDVKAYAIEVIDAIRAVDTDNVILVGSPNWDQDVHIVADNPIVGQTNIMYTLHFYAATHGQLYRDRAEYAMGKGIPIFVSESAGVLSSGDGAIDYTEWNTWISWMEANQISWINWSISDKNETCSALKTSASSEGNWDPSDMKESGLACRSLLRKYHYNYEPARIFKAMAKGRRGEDLKIGVIGGSITQGYAASSESKRWGNLMADWWEEKFPSSKVDLINAGWGGTGSDIGVHRAYDDLLSQNPDFIVIEFAVNDTEGEHATKMMEGLVQQIIASDNSPGLMILMLKQDNGTTAQASHKLVGDYYQIPMVSFADLIDAKVAADGISLSSIFVDGLHPNDVGMAYIAEFIKDKLDTLFADLPAELDLPDIDTQLKVPFITDTYSKTIQLFSNIIVPNSNIGWNTNGTGWETSVSGSQIDFKVMANSVSLIYTRNDNTNRGKSEVWVDNGAKTTIDSHWDETWGTGSVFCLVQDNLSDGEHILHIRSIEESNTAGHYVDISRILLAGNIGSIPPIAKTSSKQKGVVNRELIFSGIESFDPDGEEINAYSWSVDEKPIGSTSNIINSTDSICSFVPDVAGEYIISLIVNSGYNQSVPVLKMVSVRAVNSIPVANAGNDRSCATGKYITFDGSGSYDSDGDSLIYQWVLESAPEGSLAGLVYETTETSYCKFDLEGEYIISLVVFDSIDYSEKSSIKVNAIDGYSGLLNKSEAIKSFKIFPNPTRDLVTIEYFLEKEQPITIEVYSLNGEKLASIVRELNSVGKNKLVLELKTILSSPGTYLINFSDGNRISSTRITILS